MSVRLIIIVRLSKSCERGDCVVSKLLNVLREAAVNTEPEGVYISNEYFDRCSALASGEKWCPALSETTSARDFSLCSSLSSVWDFSPFIHFPIHEMVELQEPPCGRPN